MPLRILRLRGLVGSSVVRGFLVTAMYSTFFLGTLYLEHVRHYSALRTGLSFMPLLTIAMADVPAADAGLGSGIVNVSQQVSGALGIAVLGTIATNHTKALEAHGQSLTSGLLGGYHLAFLIGAGSAVVGILVALVVLRARPAAALESVKDGEPAFIGEPEPELERQAA